MVDFLRMRAEMGYDMTERLFPRDLTAAHGDLVMERDKGKLNDRAAAYEAKFPDVKKSYRRLNRIFKYQTKDYIIRPARNMASGHEAAAGRAGSILCETPR